MAVALRSMMAAAPSLTNLEKQVLILICNCVLRSQTEGGGYSDSEAVAKQMAAHFEKNELQITYCLRQLRDDGYITTSKPIERGGPLPERCLVFPTSKALRLHADFKNLSDEQLQRSLSRLPKTAKRGHWFARIKRPFNSALSTDVRPHVANSVDQNGSSLAVDH